jgi:hypothetical protein
LVDRAATKAAVTVLAGNRHRWLFPAAPGASQRDGATLGRRLSPVNSGCVTPQPVGGHLDPEAAIMAPAKGEQGGGPALGGWHVGGPSLLPVGRQKNGPIHRPRSWLGPGSGIAGWKHAFSLEQLLTVPAGARRATIGVRRARGAGPTQAAGKP